MEAQYKAASNPVGLAALYPRIPSQWLNAHQNQASVTTTQAAASKAGIQ